MGFGKTTQLAPVAYKDKNGKTQNYRLWVKDNAPYIIVNDTPILVGGTEQDVIASITQAYNNDAFGKTKLKSLLNELGLETTSKPQGIFNWQNEMLTKYKQSNK